MPSVSCADESHVRSRAEAKTADIERKIRSLQVMKRALQQLVSACKSDGPASKCSFLEIPTIKKTCYEKAALPIKRNVLPFLAAIPVVFVAVVSHFAACPACWPLVGGLISALGLTSLLPGNPALLMVPLFVGCLLLAIAPLALQARRHLQPFILGLIASAFVLVGKFLSKCNCGNGCRHCHSRCRIRLELSRAACD